MEIKKLGMIYACRRHQRVGSDSTTTASGRSENSAMGGRSATGIPLQTSSPRAAEMSCCNQPLAECALIGLSRRFVAAFENRVVEIGRVRLTGIEFNDHSFVRKVDDHVLDAVYFHQHGTQFSHAFVAIFA